MTFWKSLLIQKFLELGKVCILKVPRKLRSPVKRLCRLGAPPKPRRPTH